MPTIAHIVSIASGFALMRYPEPPSRLLATSLVIDAALAPLTATIAARRGRSPVAWAFAGFLFGMWALAAAMLVPARRQHGGSNPDPASDAA
ncbi:MAG TPA: hypothetical protein VNF45_03825 [Candidatus Binataceae bacterium]|nr:hypothetical protein [Candidatus Binataceae bacterium]